MDDLGEGIGEGIGGLGGCALMGTLPPGDRPLQRLDSLSALRLAQVDVQVGRDGEPGMAQVLAPRS